MTNFKVEEAKWNGKNQDGTIYDLSCLFKDEEVMVVAKEKDIDYDLSFLFREEDQVMKELKFTQSMEGMTPLSISSPTHEVLPISKGYSNKKFDEFY